MAHVGYDIEDIGPFLASAEMVSGRCLMVMSERAATTAAAAFWEPVHGERRVSLPALPELVTLLLALGRLPRVALAERTVPAHESLDDLLEMARRQLWVRPGSSRDRRLADLVSTTAHQGKGGWTLQDRPSMVGLVAWESGGSPR